MFKDTTSENSPLDVQPKWIIRNGVFVTITIFCLLILVIFSVKVPETINSKANLIFKADNIVECYAILSKEDLNDIHVNQKVNISLNDFPADKFGVIKGVIVGMDSENKENAYLIRIALMDGHRSTYGKMITVQPRMDGVLGVLTVDTSLAERILKLKRL